MRKLSLKNFALFRKTGSCKVGLDIGTSNLKMVQVEKKAKGEEITAMGMMNIRNSDDLSKAIKDLSEQIGISNPRVNISLSGEDVVVRYLSLPKMNEEELKKAITFALEDHIPFKPEEVYTDYHIIGEELTDKNKIKVLLVAVKKEYLEKRVEVVRQAGFEPEVVSIDALSLMHTFYFNYPSKVSASIGLLNIGDRISNLIIVRERVPYFVRDTKFGGKTITTLIQSKLSINTEEAEKVKYSLNTAPAEVVQSIKGQLTSLLNEIYVSLDFYENLTQQRVNEVYISGGSSQLPGLKEFLNGYLNSEVFNLESVNNFSLTEHISPEEAQKLPPFLAVALGLALEEV